MKVVIKTNLYLSLEENNKIKNMIYDIEDLLTDMAKQGITNCSNSAYKNLVEARNRLEWFLDEIDESDEE